MMEGDQLAISNFPQGSRGTQFAISHRDTERRGGQFVIRNSQFVISTVAVVLPAFNEAPHIAALVGPLVASGKVVIVVDDGSTDNTSHVAREAGAVVLRHLVNCGPGAATQTGLTYAYRLGAEYVVTCDADGQHEIADIDLLLAYIQKEKKDVIFGSRFMQENKVPFVRRMANWFGNIITFFLSGIYLSDSQSGLKVFSRKALEHIHITANGFEFCTEIVREVAEAYLSYAQYPIRVYYSAESMAKGQNISTGIVTVCKLIIRSLMRG